MREGDKQRASLRISEMSQGDRPQEKMLSHGPKSLSDAELLALILRTGTQELNVVEMSRQLLRLHTNSLYELYKRLSTRQGAGIKGIGTTKTVMLMAALEIGVRLSQEIRLQGDARVKVDSSRAVYDYMYSRLFGLDREELWLLMINAGGVITSAQCLSRGGVSETTADPKLILKTAILEAIPAIILVHNHPSGSLTPSAADDDLTRKISKGCELVDLKLLDHIIFTDSGYYSYSDERRLLLIAQNI